MADKGFRCRLITPLACLVDDECTYAQIPAWDGAMGVMPNRAPVVAKLGLGELRLDFADSSKGEGGTRSFLVEDGFVQMVDNRLTILAAKALAAEAIVGTDAQAELTAVLNKAPSAQAAEQRDKDRRWAQAKVTLSSKRRTGI